jgi:hypothetical protein
MRIKLLVILSLGVILMIFISSCKKDDKPEEDQNGKLVFNFSHVVNGEDIVFDTMKYVNAAGNPYLVNEIQYFISDVTLYKNDGSQLIIDDWKDIWYVDTDLPDTWHWQMKDDIPEGTYDSITFRFGISEEKNQSLMFVNPPESNMFWPEYLGGGYHYLKLNGKWRDLEGEVRPFNFHMGIGQIYDEHDSIVGFIHNDFMVHLENSGFVMEKGKAVVFEVVMEVNEWFEDPHVFDFNYWGGDIMQNQEAMRTAAENGHNVFSIHRIEDK